MTMTDPFAQTGTDTDLDSLFGDPATDFVVIDDLDGRLISVFPKSIKNEQSKSQPGKTYDKVIADVIVHDGPLTDKVTEPHMVIKDMHLSAGMIVGQLRSYVGKGRPVIGRVNSKPSQYNRNNKAFALGEATGADKLAARDAVIAFMQGDQFAN